MVALLDRIDVHQLQYWMAYWRISPPGERREDDRHAIRCKLFAEAHSSKGKRFELKDFYPLYGPQEPQSIEHQKSLIGMLAAACKGGKPNGST